MSAEIVERLKSHLQRAAFLVARTDSAEEAHEEILRCLLLVEKIEEKSGGDSSLESSKSRASACSTDSATERSEVVKVGRRLRLWAQRPLQINAQILTAFLQAQRHGIVHVTESDIRSRLTDTSSFDTNFAQMRIIAPKNHGKVFDQEGGVVRVWAPVQQYVKEFEFRVFGEQKDSE